MSVDPGYLKINAGTLFILEHGEYSEYGVEEVLVALKTFNLQEVAIEYAKEKDIKNPSCSHIYSSGSFVSYLCVNQYAVMAYCKWFDLGTTFDNDVTGIVESWRLRGDIDE